MRIFDYINELPFAIIPEYLDNIHAILYERYVNGHTNIDKLEGFENKFEVKVVKVFAGGTWGDKPCGSVDPSESNGKSITVIPVHGPIAKRMNLFHAISGGTSTEVLRASIQENIDNPEIDAIVLDFESPGGTVDGTKELADFIYANRGTKPILAHANGLMASAAYWIGSATDRITAYDTAHIGSIGVITAHYDYSKQDEMKGLKRTLIYAGKYKPMGNDANPLSSEAKDYIQSRVDDVYKMFVDSIAKHRDKEVQHVLSNMADGKIFLAKESQEVGLIDDIMSLDDTINLAAQMAEENEILVEDAEFQSPYPNFHSCRIREPNYDRYTSGYRNHNGKEYQIIFGWKSGNPEEQAYRYPKDVWAAEEARKHCENHKGSFEPARDNKQANSIDSLMERADHLIEKHILK